MVRSTAPEGRGATAEGVNAPEVSPVEALPQAQREGEGLRFVPDADHQDITAVRTAAGFALAWTDAAHEGLWFGRSDVRGLARARGSRVHTVVAGEEGVASPAVLATGEGFAVAWVDRENGRVLFTRIDGQGRAPAAPTIVHEGLDDPRLLTLATSGRDFAVCVALGRGVYFARLDSRGERVGDGAMLHEGEGITAVEGVRWDRGGYTVAWTESGVGRVERRPDGRRTGSVVHPRGTLAMSRRAG